MNIKSELKLTSCTIWKEVKETIDIGSSKLGKTVDFAPIKRKADLIKTLKTVALDLFDLLSHEVGKE